MKVDKFPELSASTVAFISCLPLQLMKVTVLAESSGNLSTFIVICLLQAMSTDSSQVGALPFLHFNIFFYHFTFPGFPFILKIGIKRRYHLLINPEEVSW